MKFCIVLLGIVFLFLGACGTNVLTIPSTATAPATASATTVPLSSPTPTRTPAELAVISDSEARFKLHPERSSCIEAVETEAVTYCTFFAGITQVTKTEWMQLFPDTLFYLVDIGAWRSGKDLVPPQTQDAGTVGEIAAWHNGQVYDLGDFHRLLEVNAITITETNREVVARSFALMSLPHYLQGEVRFLEWNAMEPGESRHAYTHVLHAWTQIWGCEVSWWFVFEDARMTTVTLQGRDCAVNAYGNYIEDTKYIQFGDEGVPINVLPHLQDYFFNR